MKTLNLVLGYLFILFSFIPFIRHDYWIFRVFEYPRFQKLLISLSLLFVFIILFHDDTLADYTFIGLSVINNLYLFYLVHPFTLISRKQLKTNPKRTESHISILIFNVLQDNTDYSIVKQIQAYKPDILCFVETNQRWTDKLKAETEKDYPYHILSPLENTYGMIFFSKLPLEDAQVHFIVKDDVPSIAVKVTLANGKKIQLYCVHPEPPVPQENPRSTARDKELLIIGKWAKEQKLPVIVMGDLNDVAWSYTTELFCKTSELLDPRRGRGFFNTFNAKSYILRFPLDHIFCSKEFMVNQIRRLPYAGSDHFPMFIDLALKPALSYLNEEERASSEEKEMAEEKINKEVIS
jgi:endonuclease/exonuclease/phosphatase (EEP) superfamily protein YafD